MLRLLDSHVFFRSEFYLMLENSDGVTIFSAVGLQPAMAGGLQT